MKHLYIITAFPVALLAQPTPSFNAIPAFLDKNQVKAAINTVNNKFWGILTHNTQSYEVPKKTGCHAQFANSLWIGGFDSDNLLHVSANTYRQLGTDFWAGPLDTVNVATYSPGLTAPYNRLWKVDCKDITQFVDAFNSGAVFANTYTVPDGILNYPAYGTGNFMKRLAPFVDVDGDGSYLPKASGDYPVIRGHQQILSIYNDALGQHTETQGAAMGLEIHERAYAFYDSLLHDTMQAVNYTTFYHYTIYNRSDKNYFNVYISDWSDVDVGYPYNDHVGTDSANHFTYCYNAGNYDYAGLGQCGYAYRLPVVSHALLKTDCGSDGVDNNHNAVVDEQGEQFLLDRSTYYNNNISPFPNSTTHPENALHYYNYMKGIWKDGTPFTYGGNGYGGQVPSNYVYTGNPQTGMGWTADSAGIAPGDHRIFTTSGPFNFPAGSKIEWGYAIVFSRDTAIGNVAAQFNTRVQRDVRNVRYYHDQHLNPQCAPFVAVGFDKHKPATLDARVFPNPASDQLEVGLLAPYPVVHLSVINPSGKVVLERTVNDNYHATLDIAELPAGIYCVAIKTGSNIVTRKFVKE